MTRTLLILKARTGRWDARYCSFFPGVPATGLTDWVKAYITRGYAAGLVPTATTNGVHAPNSFHKTGRAADMGLPGPLVGTKKGIARLHAFQVAEWKRRHKTQPTELLGPINHLCVLKGLKATLPEGSPLEQEHDNHVHSAKA